MMRHLVRRVCLLLFAVYLAAGTVAMAVEPGEVLADSKLEARARAISCGS